MVASTQLTYLKERNTDKIQRKRKIYYTGIFGDNCPPIRLLGNEIIELPATGEPFPFEVDDFDFTRIKNATTVTIDGKAFCAVTDNLAIAEMAKRKINGIPEPEPIQEYDDEKLIAELERRGMKITTPRKNSKKGDTLDG